MWLVPRSCLSFQALVDLKLPSSSPSPDHVWWVTSSGIPLRAPPSWRGWKNRPWISRLSSSVEFKTWMDANSAVTSMLSAAASRASHTPSPEHGSGTETSAPCGASLPESWKSVSPPWSSSRTSQPSLPGLDLDLSERNYADWVTRSKTRSSLVREMLARHMVGAGSSYWPTATSNDEKSSGVSKNWTRESGRHSGTTLTDATRDWPTPRTITGGAESQERKQELGRTESGGGDLQAAARLWQTPKGSAAGETSRSGERKGEELLGGQAKNWMTPSANDYKGSSKEGQRRGQLSEQTEVRVGAWASREHPTPSAMSYGTNQGGAAGRVGPVRPSLESWASSPQAPATLTDGEESSRSRLTSPRRLNPAFVSWLMGYQWYWMRAEPTSFGALETVSWSRRLTSHFGSFFDG